MGGMEGLAPIDGWAIAAILAKAVGYVSALLAIGGPLFSIAFREAPDGIMRLARTIATAAALISLAVLAVRFGIRAGRISGMGAAGMIDPLMLGIVWDSPLGWAALWRGAGAVLILAVLFDTSVTSALSVIGSVLVASSYSLVGHSLGDPRWVLAVLLLIHLLAVGFWLAALVPLYRATYLPQGAALLHRFGVVASMTVAALVGVGLLFAGLMTGSITGLVTTAYGWTLLFKLTLVVGLLGLAAHNKWRLVPALAAGEVSAGKRLRNSIRWECAIIAAVLLVTATLTSVTTPPINM